MTLRTAIKKYYILFLCVNIFLPKINLGFGNFYLFELLNVILLLVLLPFVKIPTSRVAVSYVMFMALTLASFALGVFKFGFIDGPSLGRVLKFTFFVFYLIVPYYVADKVSYRDLNQTLNFQILFLMVAGIYVVFNMITAPLSLNEYMWGYDNKYRLVGLTGYAIDLSGAIERLENTTSVSMGVFVALIFLIQLSVYRAQGGLLNLFITFALLGLELLTYSRAGVLVIIIGLTYYFILNLKPSLAIKAAMFLAVIVVAGLIFSLTETLQEAGTISKFTKLSITDDPRFQMGLAAMEHFANHPFTLIIGNGYGEAYTELETGYPHLESLFLTTLFTSGLIATLLLCLFFYFIHETSSRYSRFQSEFKPFLNGIRLFVPGWFLSSFIAGNTLQTDFYFPFIFFILFVSIEKSKTLP
ncbi:MAG: O-antigen ligase family protein [Cyclobacteriaceae bacterium]